MNTRIRFRYDNEDQGKGKDRTNSAFAESRQLFRLNGKDVKLFIDLKNFYFELVEVTTGNVVHKGGKTKNTAVLLRQAKRALKELGCEFAKEKRNRNSNESIESQTNQESSVTAV